MSMNDEVLKLCPTTFYLVAKQSSLLTIHTCGLKIIYTSRINELGNISIGTATAVEPVVSAV